MSDLVLPKPPVLVIDVSRHDPLPVNWQNDDPSVIIHGVFAKFSQGTWWTDPTARQNAEVCHRLGLPFGGYHFFEPNDIARQAEKFLTVARETGSLLAGRWQEKLAPVIDFEYTPTMEGSVVGAELANQLWTWIDIVEQGTGVEVEIYSSKNYMQFAMSPIYWTRYVEDGTVKYAWLTNSSSKPHVRSGTREGWWAQYPENVNAVPYISPHAIPDGWDGRAKKRHKYWQYSDNLVSTALPSHYDANAFNGTLEEWQAMVGGGIIIPPPIEIPKHVSSVLKTSITRR